MPHSLASSLGMSSCVPSAAPRVCVVKVGKSRFVSSQVRGLDDGSLACNARAGAGTRWRFLGKLLLGFEEARCVWGVAEPPELRLSCALASKPVTPCESALACKGSIFLFNEGPETEFCPVFFAWRRRFVGLLCPQVTPRPTAPMQKS